MLRQYVELQQYEKERQDLRLRLLERLKSGEPIEPGELTAWFREKDRVDFTQEDLKGLLGPESFAELRAQVVPKKTPYLFVKPPEQRNATDQWFFETLRVCW
jgi:hypothetical protein